MELRCCDAYKIYKLFAKIKFSFQTKNITITFLNKAIEVTETTH